MLVGIAVSRATAMDETWTTIHLAHAFLRRGHRVRFIEPWDWEVDVRGQLTARAHAFDPPATSAEVMVRRLQRRGAARRYVRIDTLDLMLMRAAPLDPTLTSFACLAEERGVPVINPAAGMVRVSHKAWLAGLRDVPTPMTIVTQSASAAHLFYERMRRAVVVKPARGSGGSHVTLVRRRDPDALDEAFAAARGRSDHVVIQTYLDEADAGEKRLVWFEGEVLGGYLRERAEGEFRHNLKQGGTALSTVVTPGDRAAVDLLTPHLVRAGIRLAGIDMIGERVIEVNTVNPGGVFHTDRLHGTDVAGTIVERLERSTASAPGSV